MVSFVILKCNSKLPILINPYVHTFNWHLQVLIKQKDIQNQSFEAYSRIPGLFLMVMEVRKYVGNAKSFFGCMGVKKVKNVYI